MTVLEGDEGAADVAVCCVDVMKQFGETTAVSGISLSIRTGEFFSILGPSGCGKSTILRMISGFERPTKGEIQIQGRMVNDVPPHRRNTNLVFQQLALFPHLDVFENISFGLRIKRRPRAEIRRRVAEVLELVGLAGFEKRRVSQVSGGQQQRVAIARALINEPAVLLLDEPLGSLDLQLRIQMQRELKAIQHRVGTTFIYVTHDQSEALLMSDRMAVMDHGHIEQIGSGADLYLRPETVFVAGFLGETNLLKGEVVAREEGFICVRVDGRILRTRANGVQAIGAAVTLSARPERMSLLATGSGDSGQCWEGRLLESTFLGNTIRHEVQLTSGTRLRVDRMAGSDAGVAAGSQVAVRADLDSLVLVGDRYATKQSGEPAG